MPHQQLLTIESINEASPAEFLQIFKNVVEHSPDVAKLVAIKRPFTNREALITAFTGYMDELKCEDKVEILKFHPDLAGKLADVGQLTQESTVEQKLAGLDKLDPAQKTQMTTLNQKYREKFDFPFIICIRDNNTRLERILEGLQQRLPNPRYREILNAFAEVKKICTHRIKHIVSE